MKSSALSPLNMPLFRRLWLAALASNIGSWMHDIGAGWLMTTLSPTPVMVSLVQTATTLPVFLLALPAGALADIVDRRRYLLGVQLWLALVSGLLGVLTLGGVTTAWILVAMTFAMGLGSAMMMPAWSALVPRLVPRTELASAITLNSMSVNVARAIGPALAGVIVSFAGSGPVFILNAVSYLSVIYVLFRWQGQAERSELPRERFFSAIRSGYRFARHAPDLQVALVRGMGFYIFSSASWALLPLVVRILAGGGPQFFGVMVASLGVGAVSGAFALPKLRETFSRDVLVAAASICYAGMMVVLATVVWPYVLCLAMAVSGFAWITVLSSLQVTAQLALPDWVRSRGLAIYVMVFMGSMAFGSLLWGRVAEETSITAALEIAAAGTVLAVAVTWRWQLSKTANVDLSPSMHWPALTLHDSNLDKRGPVLVTVQYEVVADKADEFLLTIHRLGKSRRRDGAFAWGIFEHTEKSNDFIETFNVESWLEHRRQHERVTDAERVLQAEIQSFLVPGSRPLVSHYLSPQSFDGRERPRPHSQGEQA
ncbi:MAG: MFS transporter [Lysobacterales bacterium]